MTSASKDNDAALYRSLHQVSGLHHMSVAVRPDHFIDANTSIERYGVSIDSGCLVLELFCFSFMLCALYRSPPFSLCLS